MVIATDGEVIINAGTSWSTGYIVPDTELHKYRIVFRGGLSILYVDGQLQARGNAGTNSLDGLVLGSNKYQDDDWFNGTIKKFKIYTR